MGDRGRRCRTLCLHPLRQEGRDDAGQDVAGPRGREHRRAVRRDEHSGPGRPDERVRSLEHDDRAVAGRCTPHGVEPVRVDVACVGAEQPGELSAVRSEDGRRRARERTELPERVRVEDDR